MKAAEFLSFSSTLGSIVEGKTNPTFAPEVLPPSNPPEGTVRVFKTNEKRRKQAKEYRKNNPKKVARVVRRWQIKQFGWTEEDLTNEIKRQNYSCYGCLEKIDEKTACIDHNHDIVPKKPRGLLCKKCNWALGNVNERSSTLRRLMAYLDHDREKQSLYLAGSLRNSRIPQIGNELRSLGYDVMDEWITPGPEADDNWQKYESLRGRTYQEALRGRSATNTFLFDRAYIDLSDVLILVAPAGKSAMLELGYAKGRGKKAYILLDGVDPERYDVMPGFADEVFKTVEDLIKHLKEK